MLYTQNMKDMIYAQHEKKSAAEPEASKLLVSAALTFIRRSQIRHPPEDLLVKLFLLPVPPEHIQYLPVL